VPENEEDVAIVNAVVELGHALKLSVTAEGVETTEQLGNLQLAGCDTAQGFLFFRPEPPEEVAKLFAGAKAAAEAGIVCTGSPPAANPDGAGPVDRSVPQKPQRPARPVDSAARRRQPKSAGSRRAAGGRAGNGEHVAAGESPA
jgi:hypothetical protein